jgi:urease accessory protein
MNAPLAPFLPPSSADAWNAELRLRYARSGERTIPVLRSHRGPLRIQKGFTPEGADLWHQIIVHPPGGIASGDVLSMDIGAEPGARVLLTSPGAAKWYRANPIAVDPLARQSLRLSVAAGASLEWLPLETIVFPGAQAQWQSRFELSGDAVLIAADLVCLGRPASGLAFDHGSIAWSTELTRDGELLFAEQAELAGDDPILESRCGLGGARAFASLVLSADSARLAALIEQVRGLGEREVFEGDWAITALSGVAILRWRGSGAEAGWRLLRAAWAIARPLLLARPACAPRIWAT